VSRLGHLVALEYSRADGEKTKVYRHTFGRSTTDAERQPIISGNGPSLTVTGGSFEVTPDRGICEVPMDVEMLTNPRRNKKTGKFMKGKAKKRAPAKRKAKARSRAPAKRKATRKRAKRPHNWNSNQLMTAALGAAIAAFGTIQADKLMKQQRTKAALAGGKSPIPKFVEDNPELVALVVGYLAMTKGRKANTRIMAKGAMLGAAGTLLARVIKTQMLKGAGGAASGMTHSAGALPNKTVDGLGAAAPRISAIEAARSLGLQSGRPGFTHHGSGVGYLEDLGELRPVDPGTAEPLLGFLEDVGDGDLGFLEDLGAIDDLNTESGPGATGFERW